jgi:hypothetical protein
VELCQSELPQDAHGVLFNSRVGRKNRHPLYDGLRNQHPIKLPWNHQFAPVSADQWFTNRLLANRSEFGYRLIAFAKQQHLAGHQSGQITRQIGFGIVDVDSIHSYTVNQEVN